MILYQGKIYETSEQNRLLTSLEEDINQTREHGELQAETVINALDQIGKRIREGVFDDLLKELQLENIGQYKLQLIQMLRRDYLESRIKEELGENFWKRRRIDTPEDIPSVKVQYFPLGTLFHIAAGNMDGLPVFSVMEGLLTGNVNILKLPQIDKELSIKILQQLIEIEPQLKNYIYVFDTPSTDLEGMKNMAEIADGIITWGGDEAISAVRRMAPVNAKLIEWGHKLGFAYVSGYEKREEELKALAEHIISSKQVLCSSCQVIFVDTDDMGDIYHFCEKFLPYLEQAADQYPAPPIGITAESTLHQYHDELEAIIQHTETKERRFSGNRCSLIAKEDQGLELSPMFGNCFVKRMPRKVLFSEIRRKKRYLQTAGLICQEESREELTQTLCKAGIVRVMRVGNMSVSYCGETHDGEYPLSRYLRVTNCD